MLQQKENIEQDQRLAVLVSQWTISSSSLLLSGIASTDIKHLSQMVEAFYELA